MTTSTDTPRVWIACLASYNAGRLIGEWVDATDVDEMNEAKDRISKEAVKAAKQAKEYPLYFGDPEEFAIHDYDGFGSLSSRLGEYPDWENVAKIGALIEEHGEAFLAFVNTVEVDLDEVDEDVFHQHYRNVHDSEESYCMEVCKELGIGGLQAHWPKPTQYGYSLNDEHINIVEELESYIDWDKVVQEMFDHGNYSSAPASNGGVHVFEENV